MGNHRDGDDQVTGAGGMDRKNPFQSVNDRRFKLTVDRVTGGRGTSDDGEVNQTGIQFRPKVGALPSTRNHASTSFNWRQTPSATHSSPSRFHTYHIPTNDFPQHPSNFGYDDSMSTAHPSFDPSATGCESNNSQQPTLGVNNHDFSTMGDSRNGNGNSSRASYGASPPSFGAVTNHGYGVADSGLNEVYLNNCYAYCLDRGNGQYTRLVPADMLPPMNGVPALETDCRGMIILQETRAVPPHGRPTNSELIVLQNMTSSPNATDSIQSHIDSIVASSPPPPAQTRSQAMTSSMHPPRRMKVYCDKWVHEGVCAFTQQGCKYKHDMPLDRETQHQLGLFHGLPTWWKKHQTELTRPREPVTAADQGGSQGTVNIKAPVDLKSFVSSLGGGSNIRNPRTSVSATQRIAPDWLPDDTVVVKQETDQKRINPPAMDMKHESEDQDGGSCEVKGSIVLYKGSPYGPIGPPRRNAGAESGSYRGLRTSNAGIITLTGTGRLPASTRLAASSEYGRRPQQRGALSTNPYSTLEGMNESPIDDEDQGARLC